MFHYNNVVAAYHIFVCALFLVQGGKWTHLPPCTRYNAHKIYDMLPQHYYNETFILLTRDFS
jgi:hypothetical protein